MISFSKPFSERKTDDQSKIVTGHRHFGSFLRHGIRLTTAFRNLPSGCAHTIKADHQGDGEFEYEAELSGQRNSIPSLAKKVIAHARSKGFHVVESEIKHDDADLKFKTRQTRAGRFHRRQRPRPHRIQSRFGLGQKLNPTRKQRPSEIPSGFRRPFVVFIR